MSSIRVCRLLLDSPGVLEPEDTRGWSGKGRVHYSCSMQAASRSSGSLITHACVVLRSAGWPLVLRVGVATLQLARGGRGGVARTYIILLIIGRDTQRSAAVYSY